MQVDRMLNHVRDAMNVEGDIIEFGVYKATTFVHLVKAASAFKRNVYGIDSFKGLPEPTRDDWNPENTLSYPKGKFKVDKVVAETYINRISPNEPYTLLEGFIPNILTELPEDNKYAFALVDLTHYTPTKQALEYIWDKMSYGGTIYFASYQPHIKRLCNKAISEFVEEKSEEVNVTRQMMIGDHREVELAVKCLNKKLKPKNWSKSNLLKKPITIALVLKTGGGVYDYKYVNNIAEAIKEHTSLPHDIVCLTDNNEGITNAVDKTIRFKHNFPKWWGKVELFREDLFKDRQVFYFDLDTFVIDNIDDVLMYDGEFCALRDFFHLYKMGSGLMSWNGNRANKIYSKFTDNATRNMNHYAGEGDQAWIYSQKPSIEYFQDIFPNEIVSYKRHCLNSSGELNVPNKAKIICFHGKPRPHEVKNSLKEYWKY